MEAVTLALAAGIVFSALLAIPVLYRLRSIPASRNRDLVQLLLCIYISAVLMFLVSSAVDDGPGYLLLATSPTLLILSCTAVYCHLMFSLNPGPRYRYRDEFAPLLYIPVLMMAVLVWATAGAYPELIHMDRSNGFTDPHYGQFISFGFSFTGALYIGLIPVALYFSHRNRPGEMQLEMYIAASTIGVGSLNIPFSIWPITGVCPDILAIFTTSFVVWLLAYAVIKKSPLIVPRREAPAALKRPESDQILEPGAMYLVIDRDRDTVRELFTAQARYGREGLWITRRNPRTARERWGLVNTPFIWLTTSQVPGETCIGPGDTSTLSAAAISFIETATDPVILISAMEYLLANAGFKNTLGLVHFLNDRVMRGKGTLIIAIDPDAFKPEQLSLLSSEALTVIRGASLPATSDGPERGTGWGPAAGDS